MQQYVNHFQQPSVMHLQGRNVQEALQTSTNGGSFNTGENKNHRGNQWSPYEVNGGTVAAISVEGKIIIGSDTR